MTSKRVEQSSRIGKLPVPVPKGVQVSLSDRSVTVKGPKGQIVRDVHDAVTVVHENDELKVGLKPDAGPTGSQYQGLIRSLLTNAVKGVSEGFKRSLDLHGVGYRAELTGQQLTMSLGLSHPVKYTLPDAVSGKVEIVEQGGLKRPRIHLESYDNELLGQTAARIRSFRPPEPYKGKGIRYTGERVREKAGKAGAK